MTGPRENGGEERTLATLLFVDIVESTENAARLGDQAWRELLQRQRETVRSEVARWDGQKIDAVGDGFLATFDAPARGIRCALAVVSGVNSLGLEVRCGLHTGEIEVTDEGIAGIAVHIGARVGALAGPSEVLVSKHR